MGGPIDELKEEGGKKAIFRCQLAKYVIKSQKWIMTLFQPHLWVALGNNGEGKIFEWVKQKVVLYVYVSGHT